MKLSDGTLRHLETLRSALLPGFRFDGADFDVACKIHLKYISCSHMKQFNARELNHPLGTFTWDQGSAQFAGGEGVFK